MDPLLQHFAAHPFLASAAGVLLVAVIAYELRQRAHAAAAVSPFVHQHSCSRCSWWFMQASTY